MRILETSRRSTSRRRSCEQLIYKYKNHNIILHCFRLVCLSRKKCMPLEQINTQEREGERASERRRDTSLCTRLSNTITHSTLATRDAARAKPFTIYRSKYTAKPRCTHAFVPRCCTTNALTNTKLAARGPAKRSCAQTVAANAHALPHSAGAVKIENTRHDGGKHTANAWRKRQTFETQNVFFPITLHRGGAHSALAIALERTAERSHGADVVAQRYRYTESGLGRSNNHVLRSKCGVVVGVSAPSAVTKNV